MTRKGGKEIQVTSVDRTVSAVKALVGAVPFAGSLLSELVSNVVPNQQLDRLSRFARHLEARLAAVENKEEIPQFEDPHFSELLEEGAIQATRALSEERISYIAELVANGLAEQGHGCQAYTVDSLCLSIQMSQPRLAADERVKANVIRNQTI